MSMPNIPDVNPDIDVDRQKVINLLLASIAFEELGLAHITNAEAEKIQYILGTLEGHVPLLVPSINDLIKIDRSVERMLRGVIKNQMLLQFKLEDILDIPPEPIFHVNTATVSATFENQTFTATDSAYYYTFLATSQGGVI